MSEHEYIPLEPSSTPAIATRLGDPADDGCGCEGGARAIRGNRCVDCGGIAGDGTTIRGDPGTCRACKKPIQWATSELGKAMPIDAEPDARGNVELVLIGGGPGVGARVRAGDALDYARSTGTTLFLSHHFTCPEGDKFRRNRPTRGARP